MSIVWELLVPLSIFWSIVHLISFLPTSSTKFKTRRTSLASISVSFLSLHISTTLFNSFPKRIIAILSFGSRQKVRTSRSILGTQDADEEQPEARWIKWWDMGAIITLLGVFLAQMVLLWCTFKSLYAFYGVIKMSESGELVKNGRASAVRKLIRRGIAMGESTSHVAPSEGLVVRPLIPGWTVPLSTLPVLLLSLLISQSFHELGHALAAACESIPLLSTGLHLHLILPTFYVSLPTTPSGLSKKTDLRIASAGVWHNVLLCGVAWLLSIEGAGLGRMARKSWSTDVEGGVMVVSVDKSSPLYKHLAPGSLITHLDDVELDSTASSMLLWNSYLLEKPSSSSPDTDSSLGWCLSSSLFSPSNSSTTCCPTSSSSSPSSPQVCFTTSTSATPSHKVSSACLNPLPYFPPSPEIPSRCSSDSSCEDGDYCVRPREDERLLRIGVRVKEGESEKGREEGRTVVWQGSRRAVAHSVTVTDVIPRFRFVPLTAAAFFEDLYSLILSLSLALGFFNLLPLPALDGSHILTTFFHLLSSSSNSPVQEMEEGQRSKHGEGLLEDFLGFFPRREWGEEVVHRVERWTVAQAIALAFCTVVVELGSTA